MPKLGDCLSLMQGGIGRVVDLLYPPVCGICGVMCEGLGFVCADCDIKLQENELAAYCPRCAMPLAHHGAPCPWCLGRGIRPIEGFARLGTFTEPLRSLIHDAKYHRQWTVAERLADRLFDHHAVRDCLHAADRIVPVPLHLRRRFWRGYNQADVIARRLASLSGRKVIHPLLRVRDTISQTRMTSQKARAENVRGAFRLIWPRALRDRHVVLVDDVMTSGATLREVARTLQPAGPASIRAVIVAVADPHGRGFKRV